MDDQVLALVRLRRDAIVQRYEARTGHDISGELEALLESLLEVFYDNDPPKPALRIDVPAQAA